MDLQFWIWLIAIVAMFLARAMRKSPKTSDPAGEQKRQTDYDDSSGNKPMTFEELLREIQQSKTPAPSRPEITRPFESGPPIRSAPPQRSYETDYDDDLRDEEQDLETIPATRENRSTEIYEQAKLEAFHRKSLEETMNLESTDLTFSHFKGYEEAPKNKAAGAILKEFSDPEGFKKAFIMSEILKRKF
jgi:hypothetical protein